MEEKVFKSTVTVKDGLTIECNSKKHTIVLDKPEISGGNDLGMTPIDALLGSLGGCKAIVAKITAKEQGFEYSELKIKLEGVLNKKAFYDDNPGLSKGLVRIHTKYYIKTEESDEVVDAFIEIVEANDEVLNFFNSFQKG